MAHETELKFTIPASGLAALRRAVATTGARRQELAARYVDTRDQDLARARGALRLRREDGQWVQTLKAEGRSPVERLEHEVLLPPGAPPAIDLRRHDGHPAGLWLKRVLAGAADPTLTERYGTDIRRTLRRVRSGGALVELALDEGVITADGGTRTEAVLELEMELKSGPLAGLLALAARWVDRFGLVLDVRSKSERGHLLALGQAVGSPARQRPQAPLPLAQGWVAVRAALLANPLQQALANTAPLAEGRATADHLHQLRVALRRLRGVQQLYGAAPPAWPTPWGAALAELAGALGSARDSDVLAATLWPALREAGAPLVELPTSPEDAAAVARQLCLPATQHLWLDLLAASLAPAAGVDGAPAEATTTAVLAAPMRRLWKVIRRDARQAAGLDESACHRLRRRIKRLRYALDATRALWHDGRGARMLAALAEAQQRLGEWNDTTAALHRYRTAAQQDGRAWFAVGWLTARQAAQRTSAAPALAALAELRAPWRRR